MSTASVSADTPMQSLRSVGGDAERHSAEKVVFSQMWKRPALDELFRQNTRLTTLVFDTVRFETANHRAPHLLRDIVFGSDASAGVGVGGGEQRKEQNGRVGGGGEEVEGELPAVALPPSVTSLTCDAIRPTTEELALLARCGNVVELSLARNTIGAWGLRRVLSMRQLTSLDLSRSNIHDFVGAWGEALCRLTTLKLAGNKITAYGFLNILDELPTLVSLDVSGNKIDFEHLAPWQHKRMLAKLSKLRKLNISDQPIGDYGVAVLVYKTPLLEELRVQNCNLTPAATPLFGEFHNLIYADAHPLRRL